MNNQKMISLTFDSSLSNLCESNKSFDTGVLRICYTGLNRNGSYISKEDIEKSLHTIYNCPVVCNYDRDSDTLGGHDMEIVRDDDGGVRLVNLTQPVGVIPESANVWFDTYTEDDGAEHEYLYADVLLWKRQEAYRKIKNDGAAAHSMEITVNSGETVDGVYHIHDFEFTAFALIGVEPCFEGSALEMFSAAEFKEQYAQMMKELKEEFTTVDTAEAVDNKENFAKGGNEVLEQEIENVAEAAVETAEATDTVEVFENSVANTEEPVAEFSAEAEVSEVAAEANEENGSDFALNSNIEEELRREIGAETFRDRWGDECRKYWFVDFDEEASMVYFESVDDWTLYGCTYTVNGDAVTVNFESKKRMKWVIAEFDGGEDIDIAGSIFGELGEKLSEHAEFKAMYDEAAESIKAKDEELTALKEFKANAESEHAKAERDEVFSNFADLEGVAAFEELKASCEQYAADELEEKCFAIRGRIGTPAKFSAQEDAPKIKVCKAEFSAESAEEPYGGLFIKYKGR